MYLACSLALPSAAATEEPLDGPGLEAHLASIEPWLAMRQGAPLPPLSAADHATLAGGGGVLHEARDEGHDLIRATYLRLLDTPAWRLWLALSDNDQHVGYLPHVQESVTLSRAGTAKRVYQYLSLPMVKGRHWIIAARDNGALWSASGGAVWETTWAIEPDGEAEVAGLIAGGTLTRVTNDEAEAAIYTEVNEGFWLLVELPDGRTLVVYQAFSDIGGRVPTWIINEMGPKGLQRMVERVDARGRVVESCYTAGEPVPPAPDGSVLEALRR